MAELKTRQANWELLYKLNNICAGYDVGDVSLAVLIMFLFSVRGRSEEQVLDTVRRVRKQIGEGA